MYILLTLILSFYPAFFIYQSIPAEWMNRVDGLAAQNTPMFFFVHLALFLVVFFVVHMVFRKYVSLGYYARSSGLFALILMCALLSLLSLIAFYAILPGESMYHAPQFIGKYVLKNPYLIIILCAPWVYLFFE